MNAIEGGVTAAKGFRASGVTGHIKGPDSEKKDCALIVSSVPAAVAGTFTTNRVKAPPVSHSESVCSGGRAQAVFINSGNANACTGGGGIEDVDTTARQVAQGLGIAPDLVCIASTGVIGVRLPMDRILQGVDDCVSALREEGSGDAALAIMTTDTVPKERAVEVALGGGTVRLGGIAKGSGMISPHMATMICILTTDAAIEQTALQGLLRECVAASFNCMCIDNDMSTSDTVLCFANGQAELPSLEPGTADYDTFAEALKGLCTGLAKDLVRDGEGASKFIEIQVDGAGNDDDAKTIARSIAASQLCKTAFFGEDPNWGRIACAAGYAGVAFSQEQLSVWIGPVAVVRDGVPTDFSEAAAAAHMQQRDVTVRVSIGEGPGRAVFWTSDLSHEYVTINADYRT